MKNILLIIAAAATLAACKETASPASNQPTATTQATGTLQGSALKKHLILTGEMRAPQNDSPEVLSLQDDQYDWGVDGPGGKRCTGKYSIVDQKIILEEAKEGGVVLCNKEICQFILTPDSVYATEAIQCGKTVYYGAKNAPPKGKDVKIAGKEAVSMGKVGASTTTKVVIRSAPSKTSQAIACSGQVPEILDLTVLARTKEKVQVDKWNNYWYYVLVHGNEMTFECGTGPAWIFGEFVRLQ
jgi:hypothetical protein